MKTIHPFDTREQFTKFHNYTIDVIMPSLPPNAWKVLCLIIRKTKGWGKDADRISYSQLQEGTGIKSAATLVSAIKELVDKNYIVVSDESKWSANIYHLNTTLEIEVEPTSKIKVEPTSKIKVEPTSKIKDTKERGKKGKRCLKASPSTNVDTPSPTGVSGTAFEDTLFPLEPHTPPPSAVAPPPLTGQQQWFAAVCAVLGWDSLTLDKASRGQVAQTVGVLSKAGYTVQDVKRWWEEVWSKDWRWVQKQDYPTVKQLRQDIGKVRQLPPKVERVVQVDEPEWLR